MIGASWAADWQLYMRRYVDFGNSEHLVIFTFCNPGLHHDPGDIPGQHRPTPFSASSTATSTTTPLVPIFLITEIIANIHYLALTIAVPRLPFLHVKCLATVQPESCSLGSVNWCWSGISSQIPWSQYSCCDSRLSFDLFPRLRRFELQSSCRVSPGLPGACASPGLALGSSGAILLLDSSSWRFPESVAKGSF